MSAALTTSFERRRQLMRQLALLAACGAATALLPLALDTYWMRLCVFIFVNIALASAWNIIGGMAGYPSFGHGVFFGIGAYTSAILIVRFGMPLWLTLPIGGLLAAAVVPLFTPLFRLRGFYFALATLAAGLAVETVIRNWHWVRGLKATDHGWNLPDQFGLGFYYYVTLLLLLVCLASILWLRASRIGLALDAIHKDETVAASVGIDTTRYKLIAFAISAFWPGLFGAIYAPFMVFISADTVFELSVTLNMIVYTVFGGIGTVIGPIIGGLALSIIDQLAWSRFLEYHSLIYGTLVVLIITFSPGGMVSWLNALRRRSDQKGNARG